MTNPQSTTLKLPNCRTREGTGASAALRSPLVLVVGTRTEMRALCPARLCDAGASSASTFPMLQVTGGGPPVPAPCPTVSIRQPNVPVDVVCGPGAVAARPTPLLPVQVRPCRGSIELVSVSAGATNASASRVLGVKCFKIRRGSFRSVRVPLTPGARQRLKLTRVLRVRAVVRSKGKLRKSKPFTILKR